MSASLDNSEPGKDPANAGRCSVMFVYWGRMGLSQLALEVGAAAVSLRDVSAIISVSRQNEAFHKFRDLGANLLAVDTFETDAGALTRAWRLPSLRRQLADIVQSHNVRAVIELMPHVWSSLLLPSVRKFGVKYLTVVHDATPHMGDFRTRSVKRLLDRGSRTADVVITLSQAVSSHLITTNAVPEEKIRTLFHPDLTFGRAIAARTMAAGEPIRLLWLGRILPYKGLSLFLDAVEILRRSGHLLKVGVYGKGNLGANAQRLAAIEAEVVNRWIGDDELAQILPRFHVVVLSHVAASQSGVAATALAAGMPVVATPVGGLVEQIKDGQTGLIARRVDGAALAASIAELINDPALYRRMCDHIGLLRTERSIERFVAECVSLSI